MEDSQRDKIDIISYGPWGVSWTPHKGILGYDNPLMHTCAVCRVTSGAYPMPLKEKIHEPGCRVALMCALGM
jgi:hypothetical protein